MKRCHSVCSFLIAFLAILILSISETNAQGTLAYSFESGLEGFGPNGIGVTIAQDTIGATEGTKSLKMDLVQNATYVGALAEVLDTNIIGNPPGVDFVSFDLTLLSDFPEEGFVDIFIVFFGLQPGTTEPGLESSFQENRIGIGDLSAGTYEMKMQLDMGIDPVNFVFGTFNEIFGEDPTDLIPSGFQITVNKSTQAPWVGYVDNVRFGQNPVTVAGDFNLDGFVNGEDFLLWQRGETDPPLVAGALADWQTNYGFGGLTGAAVSVPEPVCGVLLLVALGGYFATARELRFTQRTPKNQWDACL